VWSRNTKGSNDVASVRCTGGKGGGGSHRKVGFASVHGYLPQGTPCNDGQAPAPEADLGGRAGHETRRGPQGSRRPAAAATNKKHGAPTLLPCRSSESAGRGVPPRRGPAAEGPGRSRRTRDKRSGKPPSFWESLAPSGETRCAGRPISYLVCLLYGQTKITHSPRGLRRTKLPAQAEIESTNRAGMKKQKSESVNTDVQHVLRRASAAAHGNLRRCSRGERLRRPKSGPRTAGAKKRSAASGATQLALHRPRDRERSA